jgi:hypothetical protein
MLEIRIAGVPRARWEGAGVVADLDQVAECVVRLVAVGFMAVVTVVSGDRFDAHGEFPAARQRERPGAAPVRIAW